MPYQFLADLVLILHVGYVAFVVLAVPVTLIGMHRWPWVRNRWFRGAHLFSILVVVAQAWLGMICPLTSLESALRMRSGGTAYETSFIADWLHRLLFFDLDPWVFTVIYTVFALLVIATLIFVPPRWRAHTTAS